ncbi:MAG: alpha-galactosidase [Acidobacteriota bacterium]
MNTNFLEIGMDRRRFIATSLVVPGVVLASPSRVRGTGTSPVEEVPQDLDRTLEHPDVLIEIDGKPVVPSYTEEKPDGLVYRFTGGLSAVGNRKVQGRVIEWQWFLRNDGPSATPVVTRFRPFCLRMSCRGRHAPVLHGTRGGLDDSRFPPDTWSRWQRACVTEGLPGRGHVASSAGGRSSNRDFPCFVIEETDRKGGLFVGIGWSGDWDLRMQRSAELVRFEAGMTNLRLALSPGETVRQPSVLMGRYRGDVNAAFRDFRRHIRDYVQPKLNGKTMLPVTSFDNYYGDRGNWTDQAFLDEMPLAEKAGIEYVVLDGGWNGGGWDSNFRSLVPYIGSWELDRRKFPHGFGPVMESAKKHRRKLGIWFDIERAHTTSLAYQRHPELFSEAEDRGCHILKLELNSAREWAVETISSVVRQLNAKWIRFDFNSDPAAIWAGADTVDRRGLTEIRYLENLYRLMEALIERFPDMIIENCSSGGRRIDLETLRRSHTNWISDHTQAESIIRYHIHGAVHWLPASQVNTSMAHAFLEPNRPVQWTRSLPASAYLSHFGGSFSLSDRLKPLQPDGLKTMMWFVEVFKRTAPSFAGEVFLIGNQEDTQEGPAGIAGADPETGRQAVVVFGTEPEAVRDLVPGEFRQLVSKAPLTGDSGNDQFVSAYLWSD